MDNDLVKQLLEQNQQLIAMLAAKSETEVQVKKINKLDILKTYEPIEIDEYCKMVRYEYPLSINDCEFADIGFEHNCIKLLKKILSNPNTRPLHLCNKKSKSFYVYDCNEWKKKTYSESIYYIRRILNCCILSLIKISYLDKTKDMEWKDHNGYNMCQPIDEHLDKIITQILDIFVI